MTTKSQMYRFGSLAVSILSIGAIWLVVLPLIGQQPAVLEHISTQQRLGINPSALFYTELQMTPAIANHMELLHESHSDKFWVISPPPALDDRTVPQK
jgi:hypothetical protein